jgi:hypothetical protein
MRYSLEPVVVMGTVHQMVDCVLGLAKLISVTFIQFKFRLMNGGSASSDSSIMKWNRRPGEIGSVVNQKSSGRPRISNEDKKRITEAFLRSVHKPIRTQVHLPHSTAYDVYVRVRTKCS